MFDWHSLPEINEVDVTIGSLSKVRRRTAAEAVK
jgi:hypothetical protein